MLNYCIISVSYWLLQFLIISDNKKKKYFHNGDSIGSLTFLKKRKDI